MISETVCYKRHCKHFGGLAENNTDEEQERVLCKAFPDGIPTKIAYGDNPHYKPLVGQENKITFEKGKFEWEK